MATVPRLPLQMCTRTYGYVAYVRNGPIVVGPHGEAEGAVSTVP